jgi:hypothetical protein
MSAALAAFGTLLKRDTVTIAEVTKLDLPNLKLDTADVTSHDSNGWREFIGLLKDGGTFSADINYVPGTATHKNATGGLLADLVAGTSAEYSIVIPDSPSSTWTFDALVTDFKASAPVDGKLAATVTFKVTGAPTLP